MLSLVEASCDEKLFSTSDWSDWSDRRGNEVDVGQMLSLPFAEAEAPLFGICMAIIPGFAEVKC